MDKNLVSEIAQQIVNQQFIQNWKFYAVMLVLLLVANAAWSYLGPYFKRRGEQFATKADMKAILDQLRQTTKTAESIKSAISIDEWSHKEYRAIRRQKLEELILATSRISEWLKKQEDWKVYGKEENNEVSPIGTVELLTTLYFPEMDRERRQLTVAYLEYTGWIQEAGYKIFEAKTTGGQKAYVVALQEATDSYGDTGIHLSSATGAFATKGRKVMAEILGHQKDEESVAM